MRVETAAPVALHEWQHVLVTYDGERKAAGVRIYVNGEPVAVKILFDQNTEPIHHPKTPFRIGAGGGLRFTGTIDDVRVYNRALTPRRPPPSRCANPSADRGDPGTRAPRRKQASCACFLERDAPPEIREARDELAALRRERKEFYAKIPTVMVMADSATPRDTFVLKRGAYDAPGEKVTAGRAGGARRRCAPEWPKNRLGLARWLVDRSNPLTARVTVNRFWQIVLRHRPRQDGGRFRLAGRVAGASGTARLAGHRVRGERLGREGACRRPS